MSKINCLIGKVVSSFVRTEYLLSQIVFDLGLTNKQTDLFAHSGNARKIKKAIDLFSGSKIENKDDYILLIKDFDNLREERNMIVHSLVLTNIQNENEHKFHSYSKNEAFIMDNSKIYTTSDLENLISRIVEIHNGLCYLKWPKK